MSNPVINQKEFAVVQAAWADPERHVHGSGCLLEAVSRYIDLGMVDCAYALASHGTDIQKGDQFQFEEHSWTEIYLEAYRRSFFDVAGAAQYGTSHIAENPAMLAMVRMELVNEAGLVELPEEVLDHENLPANVSLFPALKTRQ